MSVFEKTGRPWKIKRPANYTGLEEPQSKAGHRTVLTSRASTHFFLAKQTPSKQDEADRRIHSMGDRLDYQTTAIPSLQLSSFFRQRSFVHCQLPRSDAD